MAMAVATGHGYGYWRYTAARGEACPPTYYDIVT
jgi:hypothetical protein